MNVNVNLAFLSLSILYIAFLNVIFLKKGHIKTFELDTFGKLITLNLIGILLEFGCIFTIKYSSSEILIEIVNRLFLLYLVTFVFLFSLYVFSISFDKANKKNNTLRMIIMLMYLFSVFLIFYLKLDIYNKNNIIYSYGPSTNVVYIISTICVILCFVSMIKNYKELKSKKYLPLFVFIIGGSVVALIQKINPALTLATSMEAYLLMIMYHTIENPDMKILEEVHRAKEISDNANEEKTMFLYNMTNEIRNITKDIDYSADDILDETSNKKVDVEVINDAAREIKGSTAKFTTMTNEILDINSIDSASIKVYNDKYNVKLIIKELVTVYSKKCNVKNIDFRPSIASDIPEYLYGDSVGLKQVLDIILDTLLDSVKLLPFLFITYLLMEELEHKTGGKAKNRIRSAGKSGPVWGALLGVIPQCGFSAAASSLYAGHVITVGTLLAIFLSTSDEMLPIMISEAVAPVVIVKILAAKVIIGMISGLVVEFLYVGVMKKHEKEMDIHVVCEEEHCSCEDGIFRSAFKHTLKIFAYILIISFLLNVVIGFIGEDTLAGFFTAMPLVGEAVAALVGLIPNCASSVVITELYLGGIIGAGAMMSGLLVNAGVGLLVLFRLNRDWKQNAGIVAALYGLGVFWGVIIRVCGIVF